MKLSLQQDAVKEYSATMIRDKFIVKSVLDFFKIRTGRRESKYCRIPPLESHTVRMDLFVFRCALAF